MKEGAGGDSDKINSEFEPCRPCQNLLNTVFRRFYFALNHLVSLKIVNDDVVELPVQQFVNPRPKNLDRKIAICYIMNIAYCYEYS